MLITKKFELALFFQYSHLYLKVTVQDGLKVFEKHLKKNPEQVCELLKNLQITTRYLHHLCCHSKVSQFVFYFWFIIFINFSNFVTFSCRPHLTLPLLVKYLRSGRL